ncbi:MAG TPA: acyltransferase [Trichocoleus sp.]
MYGPQYVSLGNDVVISWNGWLYAVDQYKNQRFSPEITIGDTTYIGNSCHIVACRKVHVGRNVLIADRCYLSDNLHDYRDIDLSIDDNPLLVPGEIQVGDHSWLGENVCVYGNVTIGKHCVIGANSVVTKDIPDFSVAVGSPARVVKRYDFVSRQWRKTNPDGSFCPTAELERSAEAQPPNRAQWLCNTSEVLHSR